MRKADDFYTQLFAREDNRPDQLPILPINTLRNLAVDHAKTNFIFTVSVAERTPW